MEDSAADRDYAQDEELVPLADPVEQWLDWDEKANLLGFRADTRPVEVELSLIDRDDLEIHVLPGASPEISNRFIRGDREG